MLVKVFESSCGRPPSSSRSSKVIDLGVNRKRLSNFLLVISSNLVVPRTVFELQNSLFSHPTVVWRPAQWEPVGISGWNLSRKN